MFVSIGPLNPKSSLFVGREKELEIVKGWIELGGMVIAIAGARQIGKTSLLYKLKYEYGEMFSFVFITLEAVYGADEEVFFRYISEEISKQLNIINTMESAPFNGVKFNNWLQKISKEISDIRIVILIDEIGAIQREAVNIAASTIRSTITEKHYIKEFSKFIFIISGAIELQEIVTGENSPLKNVTNTIYLPYLTREQTYHLLDIGLNTEHKRLSKDCKERIYFWTSGHPYFVQLIGERVARYENLYLTSKDIDAIIEAIVEEEDRNLPHVKKNIMQDLSLIQRLQKIQNTELKFNRHDELLVKLELIGVIKNEHGRCKISNKIYERLVTEWIKESNDNSTSLIFLSRRQWGLVGASGFILLSLASNIIFNWVPPPKWISDNPHFFGLFVVILILVLLMGGIRSIGKK